MGPRILIAEPELQVAEALSSYLELKLGGRCTVAQSYDQAVAIANESAPDILLVSSRLDGASKDRQLSCIRTAAPAMRIVVLLDERTKPVFSRFAADYTVAKARPALALIDAILVMLHYGSAPKRNDRLRSTLWARSYSYSKDKGQVGRRAEKRTKKLLLPTHNAPHWFGSN